VRTPRVGSRIVVVARHASGSGEVWRAVVERRGGRTLIVQLVEENITWADLGNYCVRVQYEGIYWMRGSGPEIDGALLAAYALAGGRGKDAVSGER
jgi:hypothetical protein